VEEKPGRIFRYEKVFTPPQPKATTPKKKEGGQEPPNQPPTSLFPNTAADGPDFNSMQHQTVIPGRREGNQQKGKKKKYRGESEPNSDT